MTIIEYAKLLDINLNSAQIIILNEWQKAYDKNEDLFICGGRRNGKTFLMNLIESYLETIDKNNNL